MTLSSYLKKRESIIPLAILAIIFFGAFDAGTTIYTAHVLQGWGIEDPYNYEISPLITSGLFGEGDVSVILTKATILIVSIIILSAASIDPRLVFSSNLMLTGSIAAGILAGCSNLYITITGETIHLFGVPSAFITLVVASSFWVYALVVAWRPPKGSTA